VKHIPHRTCVACRQVGQKRGLVRLVRTPSGEVVIDISGKKAGRGAYLCMTRQCWETGLIGGKVERSLKVNLSQERKDELMKLREELSGENNNG
jgi:predicted RNA-binding protein YlxR (DUF448 family)